MRECGQKRAFWARLGLGGSVVFLFAGVIAVSSHSTVTDAPNWTRALSDLIVAPAHAERDDRRSRRKGSGDDRQAEAALKRAQQSVQQAEAAGKRLQEADAAQKRIQQMQETAAAAQKRMQQLQETAAAQKRIQDLQRVEASQKQIQQIQRPDVSPRRLQQLEASRQQHRYQPAASPPSSNVQPVTPRQTVADRHRVALEETMAKLRVRHNAPRQETFRPETPRQTAGSRHQAVIDADDGKAPRPPTGSPATCRHGKAFCRPSPSSGSHAGDVEASRAQPGFQECPQTRRQIQPRWIWRTWSSAGASKRDG